MATLSRHFNQVRLLALQAGLPLLDSFKIVEQRSEGVAVRLGPIIGSLLGSFGGRAIGGLLGGNTGRMIGSLAGSLLGSRASGSAGGMLSGLFGGNQSSQGNNQLGAQSQGRNVVQHTNAAQTQNSSGQALQAYPGVQEAMLGEVSEEHAVVIIKAMCTAAKSDGSVDEAELNAILERLGEVGPEEAAFIRSELAGPVDLAGLLASVPQGMEQEIYAVSLLAIDAASGPEAAYLASLANGLGLSDEVTNHMKQALANAT
jgi:uncharacterized membrane protein YebE (DUF533 family)